MKKTFTKLALFLCLLTSVVLIFSSCIFIIISPGKGSVDTSTDEIISPDNTDTDEPVPDDIIDVDGNNTNSGNTDVGNTNTNTNTNYTASELSKIPPEVVYDYTNVTINGKTGCKITGVKADYLKYINGELELPKYINNLPVLEIGQDIFRCTDLTSVVIPEGVLIIGTRAFEECDKLAYLELPKSLTKIDTQAFSKCSSLTKVELPINLTEIGASAFKNTYKLSEIILRSTALTHQGYINPVFANAGSQSGGYCVKIANTVSFVPSKLFTSYANEIIFEGNSTCTSIGADAFRGASKITTLSLPDSVTSIGNSAFRDTGIELLRLNSVKTIGEYAFYNCDNLKTAYIQGNAESIGKSAFNSCGGLTSLTIGPNVKSIGDSAFAHTSLKFLNYYPTNLNNLSENNNIFVSCTSDDAWLTIGSGVQRIPNNLFSQEDNLTMPRFENVVFSSNPTCSEIGDNAFYDVVIGDIEIAGSVTSIGQNVFCGQRVESITFNEWNFRYKMVNNAMLTYDGKELVLYFDRSNITEYEIPEGTEVIKSYAFAGSTVSSVKFPSTLTEIQDNAFRGAKLTGAHLPASLTKLGSLAFYNCKNLEEVIIEEGLTEISAACFAECDKLSSVTLPSTLKTIRNEAFYGSSSLSSLVIPENVSYLGTHVFYGTSDKLYLEFKNTVGWCAVRFYGGEMLIIANVTLDTWASPYEIGADLSGSHTSYIWIRTNDSNLEPIEPIEPSEPELEESTDSTISDEIKENLE